MQEKYELDEREYQSRKVISCSPPVPIGLRNLPVGSDSSGCRSRQEDGAAAVVVGGELSNSLGLVFLVEVPRAESDLARCDRAGHVRVSNAFHSRFLLRVGSDEMVSRASCSINVCRTLGSLGPCSCVVRGCWFFLRTKSSALGICRWRDTSLDLTRINGRVGVVTIKRGLGRAGGI